MAAMLTEKTPRRTTCEGSGVYASGPGNSSATGRRKLLSVTALRPVPEEPIGCIVEARGEPALMRKLQQRRPAVEVKDAMHKGGDWVSPRQPVTQIAKLMCEHDIGAIPIGENDRLIGMVTDRDIVCKGLAQDSFDVRRGPVSFLDKV